MTGTTGDAGGTTSRQLQERHDSFRARFPLRQVRAGTVAWDFLDTCSAGPVILMLPGSTYRPDNYFQFIDDLAADHRNGNRCVIHWPC